MRGKILGKIDYSRLEDEYGKEIPDCYKFYQTGNRL
jgi:hypothetical protein